GGELDADDAAAEHDRALGDVVELERLLAGDDAAADLQAGQGARVGAGGQDDVAAPVGGAVDLDGVRAGEPAPTGDVVDLPGLHQALEALVQAADDAVLIGVDGTHVDALEGAVDADAGALADRVGHLGAVEQRLRRDAAAVQTGTAELVGLDQRDGQPQLGAAQRCRIPSASSSQDDQVVDVVFRAVGHKPLLERNAPGTSPGSVPSCHRPDRGDHRTRCPS